MVEAPEPATWPEISVGDEVSVQLSGPQPALAVCISEQKLLKQPSLLHAAAAPPPLLLHEGGDVGWFG